MKLESCYFLWFLLFTHSWSLTNSYRNIRLQDNLCADRFILKLQKPFRGDPSFTLTENRDSAAIVTQTWNTTMPGYFSSNNLKYDCHFRVQTLERPPRGIYTVITRLKFRHNPVSDDCLDFIQFSGGNRSPSERICNDISIDGPAGRLMFDQRNHQVNVHIHIDKEHMIHEPLELRMVLTAHSRCMSPYDLLCDPKEPFSCISKYLMRDNVTNCMYPCRDEGSCFHDVVPTDEMDTTNVALSAITSLIFTMLCVGLCVWICYKYWKCITVQQNTNETPTATRGAGLRHAPVIDIPTAPVYDGLSHIDFNYEVPRQEQLQQAQRQHEQPKDLPPSYESLFPES